MSIPQREQSIIGATNFLLFISFETYCKSGSYHHHETALAEDHPTCNEHSYVLSLLAFTKLDLSPLSPPLLLRPFQVLSCSFGLILWLSVLNLTHCLFYLPWMISKLPVAGTVHALPTLPLFLLTGSMHSSLLLYALLLIAIYSLLQSTSLRLLEASGALEQRSKSTW